MKKFETWAKNIILGVAPEIFFSSAKTTRCVKIHVLLGVKNTYF